MNRLKPSLHKRSTGQRQMKPTLDVRKNLSLILKRSVRSAWIRSWYVTRKFAIVIFGSFATAYIFFKHLILISRPKWLPTTGNSEIDWLILLFLSWLFLVMAYQIVYFAVECYHQHVLIRREAIYGNALVVLSEAYAIIHDVNRNQEKIDDTQAKEILRTFCDFVREIFVYKTGETKCHVSIKTIINFNNVEEIGTETEVKNIIRDSSCRRRDTAEYEATKHTILGNTCYKDIISAFSQEKYDKMYFVSNDLPGMDEYENTSLEQYEDVYQPEGKSEAYRREKWPLDYRSELVVALSPLYPVKLTSVPIIGFLCIDCRLEKRDVFNLHYDVPMVRGIADGLYDFIKNRISD